MAYQEVRKISLRSGKMRVEKSGHSGKLGKIDCIVIHACINNLLSPSESKDDVLIFFSSFHYPAEVVNLLKVLRQATKTNGIRNASQPRETLTTKKATFIYTFWSNGYVFHVIGP